MSSRSPTSHRWAYTNMTAAAVREALLAKGWTKENIPSIRTMSNVLFRHEYRLRSVAKTRGESKSPLPGGDKGLGNKFA